MTAGSPPETQVWLLQFCARRTGVHGGTAAPARTITAVVMFDFNLSNHWPDDEPVWVKSLTSSLDRRHGETTILPLTLVVSEILNWLDLASGTDAWLKKQNRESLSADLDQSVAAVGDATALVIDTAFKKFQSAFTNLLVSHKDVLRQPPGTRTAPEWAEVRSAGVDLLTSLDSDAAVGASWDDLVATAQDRTCVDRQYRPVADLLFAQLTRRGLDATQVFRSLVRTVAYGPSDGLPSDTAIPSVESRMASARAIAVAPAEVRKVVVWLGYRGRIHTRLSAGRVTFYDAHWAVPNANLEGQAFDHKPELTHLVESNGLFQTATHGDSGTEADTIWVDTLVRVDLGDTHAAGASDRAVEIVDSILNVSLHFGGGIRPQLVEYGVIWDGQCQSSSLMRPGPDPVLEDDYYGAGLTADAIDEHGPKIADALAREQLPLFLAAALEVQTTADHPFSRELMFRQPSQADISSVVPLSDRVVQHVAAFAALTPARTFEILGERWAHLRWLSLVRYAVSLCLVSGNRSNSLQHELSVEWHTLTGPWVLFVAKRAQDLLDVCRIESERGWIDRMLRSVSDHRAYSELVGQYQQEGRVLEARRTRVRNSLVHGNPAHFDTVTSVRSYSEFLATSALHSGIEAYVSSADPATVLSKTTAEYDAMLNGVDCATYWRAQVKQARPQSRWGDV